MNNWIKTCLTMLMLCSVHIANAQAALTKPSNIYHLENGKNDILIDNLNLHILIQKANIDGINQEILYGFRGDGQDYEIIKIDIKINNKSIFVPYNMYAKLLNPSEVLIKKISKTDKSIAIHGGDAGASYIIKFKISNSRLVEVVALDPENPDDPLWITRFPRPKHPMD